MPVILLAVEHTLFRDSLALLIESCGIEAEIKAVSDIDLAIDAIHTDNNFNLIVIDIDMPGFDGIEALSLIRDIAPSARIAILSCDFNASHVADILALGTISFIPKTISASQFREVIRFTANGGIYQPMDLISAPDANRDTPPSHPAGQKPLTPREWDVMTLLGEGLSNKAVAANLGIEEVTVRLHLRGIFRKLNAKNRVQAVIRAMELGLLPRPAANTPPILCTIDSAMM